jgi:hypothetical protein
MRKSALINPMVVLLSLALAAAPVMAQEIKTSEAKAPEARPQQSDTRYYRLEFVLKELGDDGHVVNSRTYHTAVSTDGRNSSVRTGTKIPIRTSDKDIQYIDVGVNIDCSFARETPQGLALQITAEISSLANPSGSTEASTPIVRANRWSSMTLVPIGKPTVVFSSDNLENKGRIEIEVTVTPVR